MSNGCIAERSSRLTRNDSPAELASKLLTWARATRRGVEGGSGRETRPPRRQT